MGRVSSISARAASLAAYGSSHMTGRNGETLPLIVVEHARWKVDGEVANLKGVGVCESGRDACCSKN